MANLGDRLRDKVTDFQGLAVARYSYLSGCDRFELQPPSFTTADGEVKLPDSKVFDETNLVVVEAGVVSPFRAYSEMEEIPGGPKDHQPIVR